MSQGPSKETLPAINQSDIPWEEVVERTILPERSWYAPMGSIKAVGDYEKAMKSQGLPLDPQKIIELGNARKMHLESVKLSNGLRYAIIRDAETGEEKFEDSEYHGLFTCNCGEMHDTPCVSTPKNLKGDLGDGLMLSFTVASMKDRSTSSHIERVVEYSNPNTNQSTKHEFHYTIDPADKFFRGYYKYTSKPNGEYSEIRFGADEKRNKKNLEFKLLVVDTRTQKQIDFDFERDGKLALIRLWSREFSKLNADQRKLLEVGENSDVNYIELIGETLNGNLAKLVVQKMFGVTYQRDLTLNRPRSMSNIIKNTDTKSPQNPRGQFVFANATEASAEELLRLEEAKTRLNEVIQLI